MAVSHEAPSGFAYKTVFSFLAQVITFTANFTAGVLIARLLGPEGRGGYALITSGYGILFAFVNLGFNFAVPFFVGREKWPPLRTYLLSTLCSLAVFAVVVGAISLLGPQRILGSASLSSEVSRLFWVFLLFSLPLMIIGSNASAVLRGRELIVETVWPGIISVILRIGLMFVTLFFVQRSLSSVVFSDLSSQAIDTFLMVLIFWSAIRAPWSSHNPVSLRRLLSYGYKVTLGSFLFMLHTRADLFLVNYYIGEGATGIYSIAMVFAELTRASSNAVFRVLFARLVLLEDTQRRHHAIVVHRVVTLIGAPAIILLVAGTSLIPAVYGDRFVEAIVPALICLAGCAIWPQARTIAYLCMAEGKVELNLWATAISVAVMVTIDIILIPRIGIVGAAAGYSASLWIYYVLLSVFAWRSFGVNTWAGFLVGRKDYELIATSLRGLLSCRTDPK